jgi:hypothetical protein
MDDATMLLHLGRDAHLTACGEPRSSLCATDDRRLFRDVKAGRFPGGKITKVCPSCDPPACEWRAFGCAIEARHRMHVRVRTKPIPMCNRCASLFDATVGGTTAMGAPIPALCEDELVRREPLGFELAATPTGGAP